MKVPAQIDLKDVRSEYWGGQIEIGENVDIQCFTSIICFKHIKIGDNTMIAPGAVLVDANHYTGPELERTREMTEGEEIIIGKNCWIGANAVILKGVTLGDGCIVGAGAVVTHSFSEGSIIAGNPATLLRMR